MTEKIPYKFYTDDSKFKMKIVKYLLRSILKSELSLNQGKSATIRVEISYPDAYDILKKIKTEWYKTCMPIFVRVFGAILVLITIMIIGVVVGAIIGWVIS